MLYSQLALCQVIPSYLSELDYSTNIDYINSTPLTLFHNQVAVDTLGVVNSQLSPSKIWNIRGARVDGYHRDSTGLNYFSFDTDVTIDGISISKNDIIRCNDNNCDTLSLYFLNFFNNSQFNINAFSIDPTNGDVLFTVDSSTYLFPSMPVLPSTIIRYKAATGYSYEYTPYVDDPTKNIDALSYLPNNKFLYSLENDDKFNLIYIYDPLTDTNEIAYTPLSFSASTFGRLDIMSLMATFNNSIFNDGFE